MKYLSKNLEYEKQSRYSVLRVIEEGQDHYLETYNAVEIPKSSSDSFHVVRENEVNRLDIISNQHYGTPNNWWIIALANNMIDPLVVNKGTMLRIPSMMTVIDSRVGALVR